MVKLKKRDRSVLNRTGRFLFSGQFFALAWGQCPIRCKKLRAPVPIPTGHTSMHSIKNLKFMGCF